MKKIVAITALMPFVAMAHQGHNGLGMSHHAWQGIAVLAFAGIAFYLSKKFFNK